MFIAKFDILIKEINILNWYHFLLLPKQNNHSQSITTSFKIFLNRCYKISHEWIMTTLMFNYKMKSLIFSIVQVLSFLYNVSLYFDFLFHICYFHAFLRLAKRKTYLRITVFRICLLSLTLTLLLMTQIEVCNTQTLPRVENDKLSNYIVSRNNFFPFLSFRYFKHNENAMKVKGYINLCSRGDWFVLYQLSKNLNRPFFMDFLVTLAKTGN